ncbi:hypothetical protein GALMADRAFT_80614 [Galerina marginata CBS 339.88]|uniref:PLAC8 family protein n=1 Tax=Galerina marginata (strain CBS 339.88) TaxID=685588 RepID=A0A067SIN8_GALM3|nr:hypothetical protein GALMADRAFT_80614 [Galerina marginata CBS 339.88]
MSLSGGNRNSKSLPLDANGEREWSESLSGCWADAGTYIVACFCPCIIYSNLKHRYEILSTTGHPANDSNPDIVTTDCVVHGVVSWAGFGWFMQMMQRGNIRARYKIKGDTLKDCCSAFWCTPCELTQESREIELEEKSFGDK